MSVAARCGAGDEEPTSRSCHAQHRSRCWRSGCRNSVSRDPNISCSTTCRASARYWPPLSCWRRARWSALPGGQLRFLRRCVDSVRDSNGKKKGEGNAKNGNKYLAWAFVEAANFARALLSRGQALL